ncbi:MAG: peptide MFS transporter [Bacteroidetes bacterium]|nr:peptide MFS transporter [Bacteroidota bacterium]MBU1678671.1 peptide MFS transporter [Bacteroidota bacterium]MBU2508172.1 peptide MFS transporter [Bacteroidota bacterium]
MFKKHPIGLPVLFFTEMWERFGFYLMLGIFFLFMIDTQTGGLGLTRTQAADIYGTYIALVYLTPFLGGLLADRVLGYRKAIFIGGVLMGLGYIGLAIPGPIAFWTSLLLIIVGNGFFKPNISTLVGNLYSKPEYRELKDSGFNIFYMGINIGAFVCNFVAAYLRNYYGWGYAFAAAGVGMFIGLAWFMWGQKHIKEVDVMKPTNPEDMSLGKIVGLVLAPALIAGLIGWFIPDNLFGADSTDAFIFASIPVAIFYFSLWFRASKEDKSPIAALLSIFGVVIIFWAIFHQNGSALTIWAESYTDRELPAVVESVASTFGLVQEVDTSPREVPQLDSHGRSVTDVNGKIVTTTGTDPYFFNLPKEEWPEEGKSLKLISTEIFQSVNPFFVVILTPVVVGLFSFLRRRKKEPSTPAKIGWGLFITALSTLIMVLAVIMSNNGTEKSSMIWLVEAYFIVTIGELFLSPMGLSLVSKLSPPRITSLMMGGWFLATSIGNKLSGVVSGLWDGIDNKVYFFLINFGGALLAAVAIFVMVKWLRRVVEEHST